MKELKKKIEEKILGLPERIVKTDEGDLLVNKIGTKFVHVYNLHNQKKERCPIKCFAFFVLEENDIFEALVRKYEDKNTIVKRVLYEANENYGLI